MRDRGEDEQEKDGRRGHVTATRLTKKLRLVEGGGARLLGLGARPPVRLLRPRGRGGGHARWSSGARETRRGRSKAAATRDCGDGEGRRTSGSGRRWQGRRRHGVSSGLGLSGGPACVRSSRPAQNGGDSRVSRSGERRKGREAKVGRHGLLLVRWLASGGVEGIHGRALVGGNFGSGRIPRKMRERVAAAAARRIPRN